VRGLRRIHGQFSPLRVVWSQDLTGILESRSDNRCCSNLQVVVRGAGDRGEFPGSDGYFPSVSSGVDSGPTSRTRTQRGDAPSSIFPRSPACRGRGQRRRTAGSSFQGVLEHQQLGLTFL